LHWVDQDFEITSGSGPGFSVRRDGSLGESIRFEFDEQGVAQRVNVHSIYLERIKAIMRR